MQANFWFHFLLNGHFCQDNGVKLVDPRGDMLEASWETYATYIANAPTTDAFLDLIDTLVKNTRIDLSKPSRVVYARDTRPSGPELIAALEDGFKALSVTARNAGVTTTPILHYLVRAINTKGTLESYGEDSEEGYYQKLSESFKKLIVIVPSIKFDVMTYSDFDLGRENETGAIAHRLREWCRSPCCRNTVKVPW